MHSKWRINHLHNSFQINGIRKFSLDSQILSLNNLQILNMSDNCIEQLPKRLGDLPLVQLDLSSNRLDKTRSKDWDWPDQATIRSTLQNLNLSSNKVNITINHIVSNNGFFISNLLFIFSSLFSHINWSNCTN